jgi:hypothetical protein
MPTRHWRSGVIWGDLQRQLVDGRARAFHGAHDTIFDMPAALRSMDVAGNGMRSGESARYRADRVRARPIDRSADARNRPCGVHELRSHVPSTVVGPAGSAAVGLAARWLEPIEPVPIESLRACTPHW